MGAVRRVLVLIDGEHYPPVVRDALARLAERGDAVAACVFVGGGEKLRDGIGDYGVPLADSVEEAIEVHLPDVVIDLSDEPVLGPRERLALAGRVLALGVPYEGPGFRFEPPERVPIAVPSLAVVGTGKRVGKTAVVGHLAQLAARSMSVVAVAMGRGGPSEPEVVLGPPSLDELLARSRAGRHACSDHLELALAAAIATVGARRCGGGLAGAMFFSNVLEAVERAQELGPALVLLDGSGAAFPPVAADRTVLVAAASQDPLVASGYLNGFRARLADLIVVTMAEAGGAEVAQALATAARPGTPIVGAVLRPRPLEPVAGERVAWFGAGGSAAAASAATHLAAEYDAQVVQRSGDLADRRALQAVLGQTDADTFVVELKAAAIDVVAEEAVRRGVRFVFAVNDVVPLPGDDLDGELERLVGEATALQAAAR